ncbi:MAG: SIMPL domain-containing protein [Chloroflexi bacterium]|nr:SIMPL domain-containing protein [Chloroflexota bacterium]
MFALFRRLPWIYQIGLIVVLVAALVVLGFLALQQFQAGAAPEEEEVSATVDVGGLPQFLPPEQPQGVHVIGVGELVRTPDLAIVVLGVEASAATAADAAANAEEAAGAVVEAVRDLDDLGLNDHDVQIGGVTLAPTYQAGERAGTPAGYTATMTIRIRVAKLDRAAEVVDAGFAAGAEALHSLTYALADEGAHTEDALRLATIAAAKKARAIAEALQGRVAGLINIQEEVGVFPAIAKKVDPAQAKLAAFAAPPGQVIIRAVVRANFAFE